MKIYAPRADQLDEILALMRNSLGTGAIPRTREFWQWKHVDNPFGASYTLVAEADGKIVGLRAFMRWQWQRAGQVLQAVRAVDTATHPEYQGRGIFRTLTLALVDEVARSGIDVIYNTPNEKSRPGYLKMGWQTLGRPAIAVRLRRPLAPVAAWLGRTLARRADSEGFDTVDELLGSPDLTDLLAEASAANNGLMHTPLSTDYLRWRYQSPGIRYHAGCTFAGAARAAVVFRITQTHGMSECRFCEVLAGPNKPSVLAAGRLIKRVMTASRADVATVVMPEGAAARKALRNNFFFPVPTGPTITVRPLSDRASQSGASHLNRWAFSAGDLELF